jgi:phosphate transport system permease protein
VVQDWTAGKPPQMNATEIWPKFTWWLRLQSATDSPAGRELLLSLNLSSDWRRSSDRSAFQYVSVSSPAAPWPSPAGGSPADDGDRPQGDDGFYNELRELGIIDEPRTPTPNLSAGDVLFRRVATGGASVCLVVVGATFVFLLWQARTALGAVGPLKFFTDSAWSPSEEKLGVAGLLLGTFIIASVALMVAVPMALGMALFINEYAPRRVRLVLTSAVDLLAAVPSLIYGIWGLYALQPALIPFARWMAEHLSAIPIFRVKTADVDLSFLASSGFIAGVLVGLMIVPIITSVSRDVMAQVPRELCEGALALGGTRWGMIRSVILPFGRSGIVGATMLGFGRALGETIAVAFIVDLKFDVNWNVLTHGGGSVAALIVTKFPEANEFEQSGLVAAGLALFMVTFAVNFVSRTVVRRSGRMA